MDEQAAIERVVIRLAEQARGRAADVARGAETPRLAALLLQKYGSGLADAVAIIFDSARAADPITRLLDEETAKIDPNWKAHDRERWAARPADLAHG